MVCVPREVVCPNQPPNVSQRCPNSNRVALCGLWKEIFNASPPPQLRKDFMIPILAYQIQTQPFKPLSVCCRLRQLAVRFG
jgi:hypothetical protein